MSGFWWGWLYGTVLTFAGLLITAGGIKALRGRRKRDDDDYWDQTHG